MTISSTSPDLLRSPLQVSADLQQLDQKSASPSFTTPPFLSQTPRSATSLLFVDRGVDHYQDLIAEVNPDTEVHLLDSTQDAISQITQTLIGRTGVSSLHILSHGAAGRLELGTHWVDRGALENHGAEVKSWSLALTENADILLYGCEVADGESGSAFVRSLSQLTGADVAASNNLTGSAALGGDWTLEIATGGIESAIAFQPEVIDYRGVLAPVVTLPSESITYTENGVAIAVGAGATVTAPDNFNGGSLTVGLSATVNSDRTADRLSIQAGGLISVDGKSIQYSGVTIGEFTGGYGAENLVVQFTNPAASAIAVQALLQTITYRDASDNIPATDTRTLSITLNDGIDNSQTVTKTINLIGVNDAPVINTLLSLDKDTGLPKNGTWLAYQDSTSVAGGTATVTAGANGLTLNSDGTAYAGFSNYAVNYSLNPLNPSITISLRNPNFPVLDRSKGFLLSFSAQLNSETSGLVDRNLDGKTDRSGFSVVLLSNDLKGIELGFRSDRIFAQEDGTTQINPALEPDGTQANKTRTLFTQGEFTTRVTTTSPTHYSLGILGDLYTLYSGGVAILSGQLRDYSAFQPQTITANVPIIGAVSVVPPSPYRQKNLIFLGDNTSSAGASVTLSGIDIVTNTALPTLTVKQNAAIVIPNLQINDFDGGTNALTVTLTALNGRITVKNNLINGVTDIAGNGTNIVKVKGTVSQINTTLLNSGLSYKSNVTFSGTDTITINADDGAPATPSKTLTMTVTPDPTVAQRHDILWHNNQSGETAIWQINGLSFTAPVSLATGPDLSWKIAATGDFDRNGTTDLLWFNDRSGEVAFWKMNGTTLEKVVSVATVGLEWKIQSTGDFDGDGKLDVLWRNFNTGEIAFWKMDDMRLDQGVFLSPIVKDTQWQIQGTGDFDGDGKLDILWRNFGTSGEIGFWKLNGMSFQSATILAPVVRDASWEISGIGDFDGDGKLDILWHNRQTGDNAFWKLNRMSFDQAIFTLKTVGWQIEGTSDFDGDGKLDILWRNLGSGEIALWKMDGMTLKQGIVLSPNVKDPAWTIEGIDRFDQVIW